MRVRGPNNLLEEMSRSTLSSLLSWAVDSGMLTHIITGYLKFPLPYQGLGGYFRDTRFDQNTMRDSGKRKIS